MDDATGRSVFETLKTRRLQLEELENNYNTLEAQFNQYLSESNNTISTLESQLSNERISYKKEIAKSYLPGVGLFVGPAYDWSDGDIELVVGFGIVWKLW